MSEETWDEGDAKTSSDQVRANRPTSAGEIGHVCFSLLLSNDQLH